MCCLIEFERCCPGGRGALISGGGGKLVRLRLCSACVTMAGLKLKLLLRLAGELLLPTLPPADEQLEDAIEAAFAAAAAVLSKLRLALGMLLKLARDAR